jgi:hydroxyethylthiazole kinase-like sugar kinase family protein
MRVLTSVILLALLALPAMAQVEEELAEAVALRDAAASIVDSVQAVIDSLQAGATSDTAAAQVDTVYPGLVKAGLMVTAYRQDPLYVTVTVPYDMVTADERLLWREGKLALKEAIGTSCLTGPDPWSWPVHRNELIQVLSYFNAAVVPAEPAP